jgi:hypothetical protein
VRDEHTSVKSPSYLNKSVSFQPSVKVREFPSQSNRRETSKLAGRASSSKQQKNMQPKRLDYEASPNVYSSGGASSARHYENPSQYDLSGGSPLVSRRHGSTSNLHEPSPARIIDPSSHHNSLRGGGDRSYNRADSQHDDLSPVTRN